MSIEINTKGFRSTEFILLLLALIGLPIDAIIIATLAPLEGQAVAWAVHSVYLLGAFACLGMYTKSRGGVKSSIAQAQGPVK